MNVNEIKKQTNPYKPYDNTIVKTGYFVGRDYPLEYLKLVLEGSQQTGELNENILIIGEKSVGKSTLLEEIRKILLGNYEIYSKEFSKRSNAIEDTNYFFEEIIHDLLINYESEMGDEEIEFFDSEFFL